ncbi:MAG: hypothetical protein WDM89_11290 [Rhizomicrobium sp.]
MLAARYANPADFNDMRKRMARIPFTAELVKNSASAAPGFRIGNVFVMAGVPMIMRAMLEDIEPKLQRGAIVHSQTVLGAHCGRKNRRGPANHPEEFSRSGARFLSILPGRRIWRSARRARPRRGTGGIRGKGY